MSRCLTLPLAIVAALLPATGWTQTTLNGSAEVSVARSQARSDDQENSDSAIGQSYTLGWGSSLIDPRLFRYDLQGSYRTSALAAASTGRRREDGTVGDVGYKVGTTVFPASTMPLFFQTSRTRSTSAGDLVPSNPIRSGLIAASGAPPSDFESVNRQTNISWHLGVPQLPQVELGYRQSRSVVSGGSYQATQYDRALSASVLKNTRATHQTFRYQGDRSESVLEQTFAQRLGVLDYDLGAALGAHNRITLHAGRRAAFAKSAFVTPVDPDSGAYAPPSIAGSSSTQYGQVGYAYEPSGRFSVRVDGNVDRQEGDIASTAAMLASVSTHAEVAPGLVATATGTTGQREQVVGGDPVSVSTRTADAGLTYQVNGRWLGAGASATRGVGTSVTPEGVAGSNDAWSGEAHLSTNARWFSAGGGYDRSQYRDDILDYGNYAAERVRASAQAQGGRGTVSGNAEQLNVTRGRGATFIRNLQRTVSATASLRLLARSFVSATAGHFFNDFDGQSGSGTDRSLFWSVGADSSIGQVLRISGWLRSEAASASRTRFDQDALSAFARLEYRLRTLSLAVEYRRSRSQLQYPDMLGPNRFAGRQLRFSVVRQFGFRLR